ncbi:MAG TPA: hypothetical protein VMU80_08410 [Bryobacteraceae bacterium]|nr:hypothetical protein [Bryobacteraceae bacterium]
MAEIDITQAEADALIAVEKHCLADQRLRFPLAGDRLSIELFSPDKRENFMLDITRSRIKLTKASYQNRTRQAIILMRLDLDGAPHRNPDDQEVACPHLHIYRQGFADRWAVPAPSDRYPNVQDLYSTFEAFMRHCNVTKPPQIDRGLFP